LLVASLLAVIGVSAATGAGGTLRAAAAPSSNPPSTVYDPRLHVTWLANMDLPKTMKLGLDKPVAKVPAMNQDGSMQYATAMLWVARLNHAHYLGHSNWTLPITPTPYRDKRCSGYNKKGGGNFGLGCTKAPLAELYTHELGLRWPATAVRIPDDPTGRLFHDFQPYLYWTMDPGPMGGFDTLSFNTGFPGSNQPEHYMYVLPLLPGNPFGGAPGPALQSVDGGQAVYEPGAPPAKKGGSPGVTWLSDADFAKKQPYDYTSQINRDGSMTEWTAVNWIGSLGGYRELGKQGWTLPTHDQLGALYNDLESGGLVSPQQPIVPVPNVTLRGLYDIQPYLYWSCAGKQVAGPCRGVPNKHHQQWSVSFGNGFLGTDLRGNSLYVEVYYPSPSAKPPPINCGKPPKPPCGP
jgi:hypothetical protein